MAKTLVFIDYRLTKLLKENGFSPAQRTVVILALSQKPATGIAGGHCIPFRLEGLAVLAACNPSTVFDTKKKLIDSCFARKARRRTKLAGKWCPEILDVEALIEEVEKIKYDEDEDGDESPEQIQQTESGGQKPLSPVG